MNDPARHAPSAAEIEEFHARAAAEIERARVASGHPPSTGSDSWRVLQSPELLHAPGTSAEYHAFNAVLSHQRSGRVTQFVRGSVRNPDGSGVPMDPDALYALVRIYQYGPGGRRVVSESGWQPNTGLIADAFTSFGPMPYAAFYLGETWVGHYFEASEPSGATETRFSLGGPVTPGTLYVPAGGARPAAVGDEPTPPTDVKPPKPPKPAKVVKAS